MKKIIKYLFYKIFNVFFFNKLKNRINIFCFHRVLPKKNYLTEKDLKKKDFIVTNIFFENFIKNLIVEYNCLSLDEILNKKKLKKDTKKIAHVTFDDGYKDNLKYALPILLKYNVPATIFISDGYVGRKIKKNFLCATKAEDFLDWNDVKKLNRYKIIEIGCHTFGHPNLSKLNNFALNHEINLSKKNIEKKIKKNLKYFAYPYGGKNEVSSNVVSFVKKANFKLAFTAQCQKIDVIKNKMKVSRYFVTEKCTKKIINARLNGLCNFLDNQFLP